MKPIPVVFHLGPLQIHTYGIGLAITFWFAYRYFARRLRNHGYSDAWLGRAFIWIIVAAVIGARAVHVIAHWSYYAHSPAEILAVWHGGLSSFGGMALGIPVGLVLAHRWCPKLRLSVATDLVSVVLVLAWSIGRLLGPQLMVAGGGRRTNAWYGMYYADQVGKRVPVPLLQAAECFLIWLVVIQVEKYVRRRGGPIGFVATAAASLYGLSRFTDEYVFLPHGAGGVGVEVISLVFVGAGILFGTFLFRRDRLRLQTADAMPIDPWAAPLPEGDEEGAGPELGAGSGTAGESGRQRAAGMTSSP